jgi:hypothetical protein
MLGKAIPAPSAAARLMNSRRDVASFDDTSASFG